MRVTLSDALCDRYQGFRPSAELQEIIEQHLTRFGSIHPSERIIVIRADERKAIEQLLGDSLTVSTAAELISALTTRVAITLGGLQIPFTKPQLREIEARARKERITPDEMVKKVAKEALTLMLDAV